MKKMKTMIAVFSAAVTCVSASVLPLSNCFAAETVAVSATSETAPDTSNKKIVYIQDICEMLTDYMKEAKIPGGAYRRLDCLGDGPGLYAVDVVVMYNSSNEAIKGDVQKKITAFAEGKNINVDDIGFQDIKNVAETTNGKITAPHVILKMLTEYAKEAKLIANISLSDCLGGVDEHVGDYVEVSYECGNQQFRGEVEDKINAFVAENNIDENVIYFMQVHSGMDEPIDSTEPTGSTPIATGSDLEKTAKWGDVNTDGAVDISDVVKLNMYLLDKTACPLSEQGLVNANCAYDDVIDAADAVIINNYVCMMIDYSELGPKK